MAFLPGAAISDPGTPASGGLQTVVLGGTVVKTDAIVIVFVAITDGPDFVSDDPTPTFSFTVSEGAAEYSLDGGAWTAAVSPLTLGPLADGVHTLQIRSVINTSNVQTVEWEIDTVIKYQLEITATIDGSTDVASFDAVSTPPGAALEYNLDGDGWIPGVAPITADLLGDGVHTMSIRATSTPAEVQHYVWTVDTTTGGGGGESVPPTQTVVSPDANEAPGSPGAFPADFGSARDTPIVVDVADATSGIAFITAFVKFSDRAVCETVYAGNGSQAGFLTPYISYSTISVIAGGRRLSIRRDDGWPASPGVPLAISVTYRAVDGAGNVL